VTVREVPQTSQSDTDREVIAWARKAGVPLWSPPRVPEAAQAMCLEIERLREHLLEDQHTIEVLAAKPEHAADIARVALERISAALGDGS
jgi:hypothetical protein